MFEDLKENALSSIKAQVERFQESSFYNQAKDRYENLSPSMQKVVLAFSIIFIGFIFLSLPLGYFNQSSIYVSEFEGKRQTIRELLKASREAQDLPNIPVPPAPEELRTQVDGVLASARLTTEQIRGIQVLAVSAGMIPGNLTQGGLEVSLGKLNLRQIVDIGHQFQSFSPSIKMKDLQLNANPQDGRYFDAVYRMVVLAVPSAPEISSAADSPPPKPKRGK